MELSPSYFKIITFVFLSVSILASLKTVNFFAMRLLKRQRIKAFWHRYFGAFEMVIWLFYGLLSIEYFSMYNRIIAIIIAIILTLILFIITYYYFKEILVKVFFKLTTNIKVGDEVKNDEFEGKIIHIETNQLIIEKTDGNQAGIPFSKVIFNPLIKQSPSPFLHRFESIFNAPVKTDRNIIQQQIISLLSADLRVSGAVEPKISFSELNALTYQIRVIAFLFNPDDTEPLRELLKTVLTD